MPTYKLGYTAATKTASVTLSPDALPGGAIDLGTFVHTPAHPDTLFHHIRDILYKRSKANPAVAGFWPNGIHEVSIIDKHGNAIDAAYISCADVTVATAATVQLAPKYQPANVAGTVADFTYVSSDDAVATVSATGLVTGVAAAGTCTVTVTHDNDATLTTVVTVTVT